MHNKELLTIVQCFKTQRYYLKYTVYITHMLYNYNNFRYFIITKSLSACQAQYTKELAKFNFKIKYKPSKLNPANILSQRPDYAKGFKNGSKRTILNTILPTLQQKLQVIGLIGGPSTTIPTPQVACLQYTNDPYKPGASGPEYLTILNKTLTDLTALDPKEDPLAQVTVPCDNPASHLCITCYLTSTDFTQSLMLQ